MDELLVYMIAVGVALIPIGCTIGIPLIGLEQPVGKILLLLPTVRDFDQLLLDLIAAPVSGFIIFLGSIPTLFVLVDALGWLSLLRCTMPATIASKPGRSRWLQFERCRRLYSHIFYLSILSKRNTQIYVPGLIWVGIVLSIVLFHLVTTTLGKITLLVTIPCAFEYLMLICLIMFIHFMAEYPLDMSIQFRRYWTRRVLDKVQRRQPKAMQVIACYVGPFFMYKRQTFCDIFGCIMSYSLQLILVTK